MALDVARDCQSMESIIHKEDPPWFLSNNGAKQLHPASLLALVSVLALMLVFACDDHSAKMQPQKSKTGPAAEKCRRPDRTSTPHHSHASSTFFSSVRAINDLRLPLHDCTLDCVTRLHTLCFSLRHRFSVLLISPQS